MAVGKGEEGGQGVAARADFGAVPWPRKLSTKLLGLTILFVLIAEVLIFIPSIANFRLRWLEERLATAAAASVVLVQSDAGELSPGLRNDVLMALGAKAIAVRTDGVSRLLVVSDMPPRVDEHIQPMRVQPVEAMFGALDTLVSGGDRMLRVFGRVGQSDMEFELIIPDGGLRDAMLIYARNVAILSLLISLITAALVFFAIHAIMIRPIRELRNSMVAFAAAPDDPTRILRPSGRRDELGVAEQGLSAMQAQLQRTLGEQKHLADLGLAVSKINHDMRNILASAQLMSDRLQSVDDPSVQMIAPKLLRAIDRAVSYTEGVLAYGRAQEPPPARRILRLSRLVDDVFSMLGLDTGSAIECVNAVDPGLEVDADSEQLFRILTNLARNAVQAMSSDMDGAVVRRLTVSAEREGSVSRIFVEDTGPGLPAKARDNLFAAFRGSARSGGTGLGLAIAHELVRAHGGTIELVESIGGRTLFSILIPDQPVRLQDARRTLHRPAREA
ncbi:HAMP domain-containing histidine kinase [Aquibium carbonis]|uniref:histidine kinase n=1 Tax=Aquibium carbonis TaxID=2495581 RepID=A0A429YYM2_9HYPH|nr:HAMP domain-containing sensor histidine kinase [Aquibium carbonis]RST86541.1 HAMP domain-containing histidine kinase [Aquibium carbonis]